MYRAGIDLGGTNIKAGLVDENWNIVANLSIPTQAKRPWEKVADDMAMLVENLCGQAGISLGDIESVGIGSPGTIDAKTGTVVYSNNIVWENVPLGEYIGNKLNRPVRVSNDANCMALGEVLAGAAQGVKNAVFITLGTGVGGGIVIDGQVFEGGHAGGAELGHTVIRAGGELCTCGRRGCLEAYASASALIRETKRVAKNDATSLIWKLCDEDLSNINGQTVFDAFDAGDNAAAEVVFRFTENLGEGITDFVNIFRPDVVVLGGGVCAQGDKLIVPLQKYVEENAFAKEKGFIPKICIAKAGNKAGIIGAAGL